MSRIPLPASHAALLLGLALHCPVSCGAESSQQAGKLHGCIQGDLPAGVQVIAISVTKSDPDVHPLALDSACFSAMLPRTTYLLRAHADGWTGQAPLVQLRDDARADIRLVRDKGSNDELADKLHAMAKVDQDARKKLNFSDKAVMDAMAEVDKKNEAALREILKTYGWPSAELVGHKGVEECWLLTQHAPYDLMKAYLPAMKAAAERGDLMASSVALTIDRVLVREGKKQLYGSQFKPSASGMVPDPIEDPAHLDERRAQMGLGPFEEYRAVLMGQQAKK